MTIFDHLKQWIIDKSLKGTHWGHSDNHLTSEVTWGHLEAIETILEATDAI